MATSLEDNIKELEEIGAKMESPDIKLDEAIKCFEKGVELSKNCFACLKETEGKITVLKKELDALIEKPFEE